MSVLSYRGVIAPNTPRSAVPIAQNFEDIKIWANGNIGSDNLGVGAVGEDNLAADSVGVNAIKDNIIGLGQLSRGIVLGVKTLASNLALEWKSGQTPDQKNSRKDVTSLSFPTFRPDRDCLCVISGRIAYITESAASGHNVTVIVTDGTTEQILAKEYVTDNGRQLTLPLSGAFPMVANHDYDIKVQVSLDAYEKGSVLASARTQIAAFVLPI